MDVDKEKLIELLKKDDTVITGEWYATKLKYDIVVQGGVDEKYRKDKEE